MQLFGSSGIRGIVNNEITPEFGINLGSAVGSLYNRVIIGYDARTSNIMLSSAIVSGLLSTGAEVHNSGLVSTPTLAYTARNFDCGVMVTASHNPAQYNGIKLWNSSGIAFSRKQEEDIENLLDNGKYRYAKWNGIKCSHVYDNAIREHIEFIKKDIGKVSLKVVIDCANGPASIITPILFKELGCKVTAINSRPDGHFPGRDPEPIEENLSELKRTVIRQSADLGIAHDGDADRMVAVDEKGEYISGDRLLSLFTKYEARNKIVVPVDSTMALEESGKQVIRTRIGDVFIAQEMLKRNADFGGEPSGTWIFPEVTYCPDGIYAAARLARLVQKRGDLSTLVKDLKKYPIIRGNIIYNKNLKEKIQPRIEKSLSGMNIVNRIDGIRLKSGDSWAVVRFSGTEPKIRLTVEAKMIKDAKSLYDRIQKTISGCI